MKVTAIFAHFVTMKRQNSVFLCIRTSQGYLLYDQTLSHEKGETLFEEQAVKERGNS